MSKYSLEFKLEVVKYCIEGHHSRRNTSKKFGIPCSTPIKEKKKKYKEHGTEGLLKQYQYIFEKKGGIKQNMYRNGNCLDNSGQKISLAY